MKLLEDRILEDGVIINFNKSISKRNRRGISNREKSINY